MGGSATVRSFGIVEDKIAEADFFLTKLEEAGFAIFNAQCYLNAFLSAARSVTFAIQASIADLEGFAEWYQVVQLELRDDTLARFFLQARNESIHVGLSHIRSGKVKGGKCTYFFQGLFDLDERTPGDDVITSCNKHLTRLVALVYQCFSEFGYDIDPDMYYTIQNAKRQGRSIEDYEIELGYPAGWTHVEGIAPETRLRILRERLPGVEIDHLFEKYLNKNRFEILKREGIGVEPG